MKSHLTEQHYEKGELAFSEANSNFAEVYRAKEGQMLIKEIPFRVKRGSHHEQHLKNQGNEELWRSWAKHLEKELEAPTGEGRPPLAASQEFFMVSDIEAFKHEVTGHIQFAEKRFGDFIPPHRLEFQIDPANPTEGKAIIYMEEVTPAPPEEVDYLLLTRMLEVLIIETIKTYFDTYSEQSGWGATADLKVRHLIYGKVPSRTYNHLYLIDNFPLDKPTPLQLQRQIADLIATYYEHYNFKKAIPYLEKLNNLIENI